MIRKIALEIVLGMALLYGLVDLRAALVAYDPLKEARASVGQSAERFAELPPRDFVPVDAQAIFDKNLFDPSRKGRRPPPPKPKPKPAPAPAPAPPPAMPRISLKGIVETPSGERKALLEIEGDRTRSLRAGDVAGEFEVVKIGILEVELLWNGEPLSINIRNQPDAAPAEGARPNARRAVRGRRR